MSDEFDNLGYGNRPFYKRIWFWILVVVLIILLSIGIGLSYFMTVLRDEQVNKSNFNPIARSSTVVIQNVTNQEGNIDNSKAKAVTLNSGEFKVGKEIQEGMYIVQTSTSGQVSVYNSKGEKVQEADIVDKGGNVPMKSIFVLASGDTLKISGMENVKFTPYMRDFKTVLNTGIYQVGVDVKQGNYIMEIPKGNGMVTVNNPIGIPLYSQILNNQGAQSIKITLSEGDTIVINGLSGIHLVNMN